MPTQKEGAGVVIIKDGNILLVKHGPKASHQTGMYGLPCGTIFPGEDPKQTAIRELKEETGIKTNINNLIEYPNNFYEAKITFKKNRTLLASMVIFLTKAYTGKLIATEETSPEWVNIKNMDDLPLLPNVKKAVTDALNYLEYTENK